MKKFIYSIIVILLLGIIFWLYSGFNGNPVSKIRAEKDMKNYLETTYKGRDFKIGKVYYSMSFGVYTTKVTGQKDSSISFTLSWRGGRIRYDEYISKYAMDNELSKIISSQITEETAPIIKSQIPDVTDVTSEIEIKKDVYTSDKSFSKDMREKITIWIYMKGDRIPRDEFIDRCIKSRDILKEKGYNIGTLSIHYNTSFKGDVKGQGEALYSIAIRDNLMSASKDEMLKSKDFWENNGKGEMILNAFLYKAVITLFILGILGAGAAIVIKERKNKIKVQ